MPISFALLLNLVAVASTDDKDLLWGFVQRYCPEAAPRDASRARRACSISRSLISATSSPVRCAIARRREMEAAALRELDARLAALPDDADAETIQTEVYEVGKAHPFESLRDWFKALYETLLGTVAGPAHGQLHRALRHRQQRAS